MLRRKPTAITLTSEDVLAYQKSRAPVSASGTTGAAARASSSFGKAGGVVDPNDELKPLPGDKARVVRAGGASREERIAGH